MITDNQMIQDANIHQAQRLLQAASDLLVGLTGLGHPRWVVVRQNQCRCIVRQRAFDHFARMDIGAVQRAAKQLLKSDHPVSIVQVQAVIIIYWSLDEQQILAILTIY